MLESITIIVVACCVAAVSGLVGGLVGWCLHRKPSVSEQGLVASLETVTWLASRAMNAAITATDTQANEARMLADAETDRAMAQGEERPVRARIQIPRRAVPQGLVDADMGRGSISSVVIDGPHGG